MLPSAGLVRPKPTHRMEMEKWPGTTDGHVDPRHWCGDMQQAYKSHSVQCIRGVRSEQAARPSGVQGFVRTVYRRLERGAMRTTIPIKARSECSLIGIFVHLSCVLGLQLYAHSNRLSVLKVDVSMRHWQGLYLLGDEIISTQRLQAANQPSH